MKMSLCAGCEAPIYDRYLFNVLDKPWHAGCLSCTDCKLPLSDRCFSRDGRIYCRIDFFKRYGTRCAGCEGLIDKNDLVRRARDKVFHVDCFCCSVCRKRLDTGEELYILNGNRFICKHDYINYRSGSSMSEECASDDLDDESEVMQPLDDCPSGGVSDKTVADHLGLLPLTELSPDGSQHADDSSVTKGQDDSQSGNGGGNGSGSKRRGPRTTIKAKQLETLKAAFTATPKPTRHIREQLAQETGLNMRVIQVWFQNRRSKERRMKQLRYGGYRPGRRNRSSLGRDDALAHMFQDSMVPHGADPYFQPPVGYYCDMFPPSVVGDGGPPPHPADMGMGPPPSTALHPYMMPPPPSQVGLADDPSRQPGLTPVATHANDVHFAMEADVGGSLSPNDPMTTMVTTSAPSAADSSYHAPPSFMPLSSSAGGKPPSMLSEMGPNMMPPSSIVW